MWRLIQMEESEREETMIRARRAPLLVVTLLGVMLVVVAVVIAVMISAQRSPSLPPGAAEALRGCSPWPTDEPPDPNVAAPTDVQAIYVADEQRIGVIWRHEGENVTCYGVLQTTNVPPELSPDGSLTLIVVTLATASGTSTQARAGRSCFRIYAGTSHGRSALFEEACVDVPAQPNAATLG